MSEGREETTGPCEGATAQVTVAELVELSFFAGVPKWALARLARSATKKRLPHNAAIVRQNDEARTVYFLLSGAVQILVYFEGVGDLLMGVQREPGSLIGWSAFRAPYRYTSSVRCEEASEFIQLPRQTFEEIFEEDAYLGYQLLKKVAATVDARLEGAVTFLESPIIPGEL